MADEAWRKIKSADPDMSVTPGTKLTDDATGQVIYAPPDGEDTLGCNLAN
ncbi:MAG: hypothetical protein OXN84_09385 [Albidovulum sp.]|nr:hypothetical protein [Albidovulum sp.]